MSNSQWLKDIVNDVILKDGYAVNISGNEQHVGEMLVTIESHREGSVKMELVWRGWTFEPEFLFDLSRELGHARIGLKSELAEI